MKILYPICLFLLLTYFQSCLSSKAIPAKDITYTIAKYNALPDTIRECSGIAIDESGMFVINDGGSGPLLFHVNVEGNDTLAVIDIHNIQNTDWEAVTIHNDEILICDFGNNLGKRKDLKIYHIDKSTYKLKDVVNVNYPEQTSFNNPKHNFDCEGMVIIDDQYVLFTKNRGNKNSNIYTSPIGSGNFELQDSISVPGQVTDACYDPKSNRILLVSYNYSLLGGFQCQLSIVNPLGNDKFENVKSFDIEFKEQFEAISKLSNNTFLIGSENVYAAGGNLYKIVITGL